MAYNGWTNWETWNTNLWMTNEEGWYDEAREIVARYVTEADEDEGTAREVDAYAAGCALREWWDETAGPEDRGSPLADAWNAVQGETNLDRDCRRAGGGMSATADHVQAIAAYQSAIAHPYHVRAYRSWSDHDGVTVGFQTLEAARSFAQGRPEPLIDLVSRYGMPYQVGAIRPRVNPSVILSRRLIPHPDMPPDSRFIAVDDFPQDDSL